MGAYNYTYNTDVSLFWYLINTQFQKMQIQKFCQCNHLSSSLPFDPINLYTLRHHLLYDDSKKLILCYVPKNGCSNLKRLMLILNGILPPTSANDTRPEENVLSQVSSFL